MQGRDPAAPGKQWLGEHGSRLWDCQKGEGLCWLSPSQQDAHAACPHDLNKTNKSVITSDLE